MVDTFDPIGEIPPDCRGNVYWGGRVPGWIVEKIRSGEPFVTDPDTLRCAQAMARYIDAHRGSDVVYRGLPAEFVRQSEEWSDPDGRSRLLREMAVAGEKGIVKYLPEHMDRHWGVRMWLARFKAYIDLLEGLALHNSIMSEAKGTADLFYDPF